jgi:hypothetical protein
MASMATSRVPVHFCTFFYVYDDGYGAVHLYEVPKYLVVAWLLLLTRR